MKYYPILFTFIALFLFSISSSFSQLQFSEIMFNPLTDEQEWIELYNNSDGDIVGNAFTIADPVRAYHFTIPYSNAKQYIVLAKDTEQIKQSYQIPEGALLIQTPIPGLNNDKDSLYLRNSDSIIIDTLFYDGKWSEKGISLERASFLLAANTNDNLKSCIAPDSSTCGKANSVLETSVKPDTTSSKIHLSPNPFSPNGTDGKNQCSIKYTLPNKQFKATCKIYNLNGVTIRTLSSSEVFNSELNLIWDGTNESGFRMPVGVYPVILEITDLQDDASAVEKALIVIGR
jgi:hypothetical protein